jgi:bifunctional non-homologous end joining protein LigD
MRPLAEYHAKRDFTRTSEPRGSKAASKQSPGRFTIQRHDATRLHYDLRLELDGVYKSWAVTKVPSLDPAVKRLAVEVEDHPLDYGTFEGTIAKGEYGGGTVQLWDRGTWTPQGTQKPARALAGGHLKFTLDGERMQGGWALVRMKDRHGKPGQKLRHNWLLIKETDDSARRDDPDALAKAVTSVESGRTLDQIARAANGATGNSGVRKSKPRHAPKTTAGEKSARNPKDARAPDKVSGRADALPGFVEPALCRLVVAPPDSAGWIHEVKFDGYRMQMRVDKGRARLFTRRGLDWTNRFSEIAREGGGFPDCLLDGEIVALRKDGSTDFAALQDALSKSKTSGLVYFVFDVLWAEGRDQRGEPLSTRKRVLDGLLPQAGERIRPVSHFTADGKAVLEAACRMDMEGVVSKKLDAPYRSGRSDSWTKAKCRAGQEVVIGGWWGDGTTLRSILVGAFEHGEFRYLGRVGSGFDAQSANALLARLKPLLRKTAPFADAPARSRDVHWVEPKLVAEIAYGTVTGAGLLRQASFKALREDKPAASVVPEVPAEAPGDRTKPVTAKTKPARVGKENLAIGGVVLTHAAKELWPAAAPDPAFTKQDLAEYYRDFADRILLHLAGRPVSLVRAPDGITGQAFFQRHANQQGIKYRPLSVPGRKETYITIDDAEGLISLAQAAVVEFHPWGARPGQPDVPERIIFDLDPAPDVSFSDVIAAAKELRERLTAMDFVPFVKTTGGKGLHVVVGVKGRTKPSWPQVKEFAHGLCVSMERDSPDAYTSTMAKNVRGGKIFLDYLRNDLTATAVGPWSPRGRPHAPIATPIEWSQLRQGFDPLAFTLRTASALLKRKDPWAGLSQSAAPLPAKRKR